MVGTWQPRHLFIERMTIEDLWIMQLKHFMNTQDKMINRDLKFDNKVLMTR